MDVAELEQRVARLNADAIALAAAEVSDLDAVRAARLHRALKTATDRLGMTAARLLATIESDGRWEESGGARTFPQWAAQHQNSSVGAARREAQVGQALEQDLPGTREAVTSGAVTLEHAEVLARIAPTSPARRAALAGDDPDRNEAFLLARAAATSVDQFRLEAKRWAARIDGEAAEREHERAATKEYLTIGRRDDGMVLQGFLTHEHGTALVTALRAVTGVPAADDQRSTQERDAAALAGVARLVLDKGLAGGGAQVRPHLSVLASWETFQALESAAGAATSGLEAAELETGEPIPASVLARLACDGEISRIVFGPTSEVLDVGRAQRTYSGQLRRAVIARDRSCRFPGCGAPPSLGEIHHVREWFAHHGETSVENGILLCWYHHELVHRRRIRIRAKKGGGWEFSRPDGTPLASTTQADEVLELVPAGAVSARE